MQISPSTIESDFIIMQHLDDPSQIHPLLFCSWLPYYMLVQFWCCHSFSISFLASLLQNHLRLHYSILMMLASYVLQFLIPTLIFYFSRYLSLSLWFQILESTILYTLYIITMWYQSISGLILSIWSVLWILTVDIDIKTIDQYRYRDFKP